jgi:hypothetical protein
MGEPYTPQMSIRSMRIACWITKATDTHSEYVMHIAFPRQQWFRESASMLHYTYVAWHVKVIFFCYSPIYVLVFHAIFPFSFPTRTSCESFVSAMHRNCVFHLVIYLITFCNVLFFGHELIPPLHPPKLENTPCLLSSTGYTVPYSYLTSIWRLSVQRNNVCL